MNRKSILLLIMLVVIIVGVYISLNMGFDLENGSQVVGNPSTNSDSNTGDIDNPVNNSVPDNQFKEVELTFFNSDGTISWNLQSSIINNYTAEKKLELSPIDIDALKLMGNGDKNNEINESDSKLIYQITADQTLYSADNGQIEIHGPVRINKDMVNFTAGKLLWQDGKDTLTGTDGITVESLYFSMTGEELTADIAMNSVVIKGSKKEQASFTWKEGSEKY